MARVPRPLLRIVGFHAKPWMAETKAASRSPSSSHARPLMTDSEDVRKKLAAAPGGSVDLTKCDKTGIAVITFNNPIARNGFTGQMMLDLADAVAELVVWEKGKGLLVHGAGGFFCSGGDLNSVLQGIQEPGLGAITCQFMQDTLQSLQNLPLISASLIQGKAVGGGAEVATATDFRVMTENSGIGFIHSKLTVSPGFGGGTRLVHLVGRSKALDLLASGRVIGPVEALKIGLADEIVQDVTEPVDFGKKWLSQYTKGFLNAVRGAKTVVSNASQLPVQESLELEKQVFESLWGSEEHKDAIEKARKH